MTKPAAKVGRKGPEWNTFEIILQGSRTVVFVNGLEVTDYTEGDPVPERIFDWEPLRGPRPEYGFIGIQNHDEENIVFFKEISVKPLTRRKH